MWLTNTRTAKTARAVTRVSQVPNMTATTIAETRPGRREAAVVHPVGDDPLADTGADQMASCADQRQSRGADRAVGAEHRQRDKRQPGERRP